MSIRPASSFPNPRVSPSPAAIPPSTRRRSPARQPSGLRRPSATASRSQRSSCSRSNFARWGRRGPERSRSHQVPRPLRSHHRRARRHQLVRDCVRRSCVLPTRRVPTRRECVRIRRECARTRRTPTPVRRGRIRVPQHTKPYRNVLETIGWTPLIRINKVTRGIRTPVFAKAEFFNPGGSVKDRIGLAMIEAAERAGKLQPGGLVVEATSGNTGVGLALAAAVKGYHCIFTMPDKMSQEKARLLRALGAEVIITPTGVPADHPDNYIMKGRAIAAAHPNAIFADQHYNPVNPDVHYRTTGPELWEQTAGKITHFVCAPGTGGTVSGAGRYLKEQRATIRVIAGDPVGSIYSDYARTHRMTEGRPYKVEGIGGDKIPTSLHWDVIDEWITVSDKDAMLLVRRLAREEGLFAGGSTGVNLVAALEVARRVNDPQSLVVTVLADTGERYLSKVFNDEWLRENQILDAERVSVARLLEARNSGAPPLISVPPTATVRQALNLMSTYNVSQLPVLDGGDGVGAVAEPVLMARALEDRATLDRPVQEVMDAPYPVVDADLPVERLTTLLSRETPAALVRRDGKIAGIVTRYDVLHQLAGIQ